LEGLCSYEAIATNKLDLADVATMNELLNVRAENDRRIREYHERGTARDPDLVTPPRPGRHYG